MTPDTIARSLRARKVGRGKWMGKCPAHQDRMASLSVTDMGDGRTRLHCFAGCSQADVLASAGLQWKDLRRDFYGNVSTEIRGRFADERKLERLEARRKMFWWFAEWLPACAEVGKRWPAEEQITQRTTNPFLDSFAKRRIHPLRTPEDRRLSRLNSYYWTGITATSMGPEYRRCLEMRKTPTYWDACYRNVGKEIQTLKEKLDPNLKAEQRLQERIRKTGWERLWQEVK